MTLAKDLTKQIIGKRISIEGPGGKIEGTVTGFAVDTLANTKLSIGPLFDDLPGSTIYLADDAEVHTLDDVETSDES